MKSRFLISIRLVVSTCVLLILGARTTTAATLVVDPDGFAAAGNCTALTPADSTTISGAIALASEGDTIAVCPNVYPENVVISKGLTLRGAQAGNTGLDRDFDTFLFESIVLGSITIQAPKVTVDGFWLTVPLLQSLALVVKTAGNEALITNNVIDTIGVDDVTGLLASDSSAAIYLEQGPDKVKVTRNRIRNVGSQVTAQGILVGDSTSSNPSLNVVIEGNLIQRIQSATRGAYGIQVNNGASTAASATGYTTITVRENTIDGLNGGGWAHAIGLEGPTLDAQITKNSISNVVDLDDQDAVAVFFEANPYFPTAQVHLNNFSLDMRAYGIALHSDLIASDGHRGTVSGTCNWWGATDGPGPVGPGSGARVTTRVNFDPWLDAPAPGGSCRDECVADDRDDFDHDGKHDDIDADDDNDGIPDLLDNDHDNDGITDVLDNDDDNDGILDVDDSPSTRQLIHWLKGTLAGGALAESILAVEDSGLPLIVRVESPNAQFLKVEIYDPNGRLVGVSLPTPGSTVVTAPALLQGVYTVRVRNIGIAPIDYTGRVINSVLWF